MRLVRMLGLCLVAVFICGAVVAGSASAEEFNYMKCAKASPKGTGKYSNSTCTTANAESKGGFELESVEGTAFTSKGKTPTFTVAGKAIKCKKLTDAGEYLGGGFDLETITFTSCDANGNKKEPCTSEGAAGGTIKTDTLISILVPLNKEETQVGVALEPAESAWAVFKCGSETIEVQGGVLGTVTNAAKGQAIAFAVSGGKQQPGSYWTGAEFAKLNLYTGAEVEATLAGTDEQGPKGVGAFPAH
jgi:hypothetical protein